ncbi:hypothetical protein PFLG_01978 [Plasmodium falciparum RAJ116]|uniref:Uncharacterized protein n=1 Tax=Plasmodium falciparum RAJ116 TaxID=580058 RepID=A0A0L0CWP3_PLAFA|nr:hypothetical protein PFLG_01978 [Plasmodium falciparum RAJ116]
MAHIENHKKKKYEYLPKDYDTIFNPNEKETELLNQHYNSGINYNYDTSVKHGDNNDNVYNNNNYNDYLSNNPKTHYDFENKYNNDKNLENRILIESEDFISSRRNSTRVKNVFTRFKKFLKISLKYYTLNGEIMWCGLRLISQEFMDLLEKLLVAFSGAVRLSCSESIFLFVYIGVLLQDISNLSELENHWTNLIILFVGFLIGVIAIVYISVITKRRLNNLNIMNASLSTTNADIE